MSHLRIQTTQLLAADIGPENPLPALARRRPASPGDHLDEIPESVRANFARGHIPFLYPYRLQDGYTRDIKTKEFRLAVLENEILAASFLLEYGGRLWSLVHKPSGQELLAQNTILQLANLALRNAWFSGGVEWNTGTIGHSPLTCAPLFAARAAGEGGAPILRLYEWDRFREIPFQIDASLPAGSPFLYLRTRISNHHDHPVPIYWWSNIAVPESEGTRVLVPADTAYHYDGGRGGLRQIPIPLFQGLDCTDATNVQDAGDYFFHIERARRPWIAALDARGQGLIQVSSRQMIGRKLWVWGQGTGGRNWQAFLAPGGQRYIEIQAGLTRTQFEHLEMPAGAEWAWMEAYGRLEADPAAVHGSEWESAWGAVESALGRALPEQELEQRFAAGAAIASRPPEEILQRGSGWGALERRLREKTGRPLCVPGGLVFDDRSLSEEQAVWMQLLEEGFLPEASPATAPTAFVSGRPWRRILQRAVEDGQGRNWTAWYYLGLLNYAEEDFSAAQEAWERSLEHTWTPWALRNLGMLAWECGRLDEAAAALERASDSMPSHLPLAIECGRCLLAADRPQAWLTHLERLPASFRQLGRIRLLEAQAALAVGELGRVARFFDDRVVVPDLREGDHALSDLWFGYCAEQQAALAGVTADAALHSAVRKSQPVPQEYDFRLAGDR